MLRFRAAALLPFAAGLLACAHGGRLPAPASMPAAAGVTLAVDVGDRGELVFLVPSGWKATSAEPEPSVPGSIRFEPPLGHVALVVAPLWGAGEPAEPLGPEVARVLVEAGRDRAREGSVERDLPVRPFEPPGLPGWYFTATDRELAEAKRPLKPDEYRCLLQGAVVVGPLVLAFTLLDDGDGPQRAVALTLVRGATHRPDPSARPAATPSEPTGRTHADPSTWSVQGADPVELGLPGKAWSLLLDLPGWRVAEPMRRFDASGVSAIGQRQTDGLVLSVALVESQGRRSPESCRDADWPRIARLDGVGDARLVVVPGEARAWYTVRGDGPPTRHLSAWRHRDGTCIHLHLSLPGAEPGADPRLETALGVVRYGEAL